MQHDVTEKCLDTNFSFTSIDHGDLSSCIFLMGKWNFEENIPGGILENLLKWVYIHVYTDDG